MSGTGQDSLVRLQARLSAFLDKGVRRVSLELQGEQVTFTLRDGRLHVVCTCAVEGCEHQASAVRFFAEPSDVATSLAPAPKQRASQRPVAPSQADARQLATAIEELCLASARAGLSAQESPSIRAALDQLVSAAKQPPSLSLARFIGRFQNALALGEVGEVARLLAGAQAWAEEQKQPTISAQAAARTRAWLGNSDGEAPGSLTDVTLLEVGREWLNGLTRSAIERRYLVDLADARLYCEERRRGDHDTSVGPCPRVVHVSFGALETAVMPPRTQLLQYAIALEPSADHWQRLAELGEKSVAALREHFVETSTACPGLAEPVVLFAPHEPSGALAALRDQSGAQIELWDDSGASLAEMIRVLATEGELVWLLGRLKLLSTGLVLRPVSALVRSGSSYRMRRIT